MPDASDPTYANLDPETADLLATLDADLTSDGTDDFPGIRVMSIDGSDPDAVQKALASILGGGVPRVARLAPEKRLARLLYALDRVHDMNQGPADNEKPTRREVALMSLGPIARPARP